MKKVTLYLLLWCSLAYAEEKPTVLLLLPSQDIELNGNQEDSYDLAVVLDCYAALLRGGVQPLIVTPDGKPPIVGQEQLDWVLNFGAVSSYYKKVGLEEKLLQTLSIQEVNPTAHLALICLGGAASLEAFSVSPELKQCIRQGYEGGAFIVASDFALSALLGVELSTGEKLLKGRRLAVLSNQEIQEAYRYASLEEMREDLPFLLEDKLEDQGAIFAPPTASQYLRPRVVEDGRLITGAAYSDLELVGAVLKKIRGKREKILIVVTANDRLLDGSSAGYYLPEVIDYHYILSQEGFDFDIASPAGGKAPMYAEQRFVADPVYQDYLLETGLYVKLSQTVSLNQVRSEDYEGVHFVGGFAALTDFPTDSSIKRIVREIYERKGVVSAVCHGPSALLNVELSDGSYFLEGKKVTARTVEEELYGGRSREEVLKSFPILLEEEMRQQGCVFTKGEPFEGFIASDQRLVTGQGVTSTTPLAKEVLRLLRQPKN